MNIEKVTGITAAIPSTDEQKKPAYYVFFWEKDSSPEDAPDEENTSFTSATLTTYKSAPAS